MAPICGGKKIRRSFNSPTYRNRILMAYLVRQRRRGMSMQSKLTLRLDADLIERAKRQARSKGTSVSAKVTGYSSTLDQTTPSQSITPRVRKLRGVLCQKSVGRETYREHLIEKHTI
jgi:hypothetical protein